MGIRKDNLILAKSKSFALRIIRLYQYLSSHKRETVMSKQLLRCGTSIGANLHEAIEAYSKKDFEAKIYIALKEARETEYWIDLLHSSDYLNDDEFNSINDNCSEILKILVAITKTLRKNSRKAISLTKMNLEFDI